MLSCPRCGVETPAPSSRCDVCNTPFGPHSSEASPPVPSPGSDSSQNPTRTSQAEAATGKSPKSPEDPGPLAPGQPFGSRYRILGVLGKGGMGAVYQAWDEELKVAVALKVIRKEDRLPVRPALRIARQIASGLALRRLMKRASFIGT